MRTTFRRHVMLFLCILLMASMLIGIAFWFLFDRFVASEQNRSMQSTAKAVGSLVAAYSDTYLIDWDFRTNLSVAANASQSDILICSPDGEVQICARELQNCSHIGKHLSQSEVTKLFEGTKTLSAASVYGEKRLAVARLLCTPEGQPYCIVLVSVQESAVSEMTDVPLRLFFMTALLVIAAILIMTPVLTRRESKPIQIMAAAARQIAHGNLDVRVPTGNRVKEIEELAIAFNNMAVAVQNSETVRKEFVANVSHELKTPMTTIAGYLDGMLDGTIPQEKHREYMEMVASEARRLSRLVRSMLDATRLRDRGIMPEQRKDFDICEAAGQALLSFEQRINRKELDVEIDMPETGLRVNGEPESLTQVLYNLLDNAVKFVDHGGTLSIRVRKQADKAAVTVGNTGPTIAQQELPLIFDRFHKTDKSRSSDRDGVGLGLYIVKTTIMAHGEDIYVTSHDNKTEFTFTVTLSK